MQISPNAVKAQRWLPGIVPVLPQLWIALFILFLTITAVADKTAADYYVSSLPGQPAGPLLNMHAG